MCNWLKRLFGRKKKDVIEPQETQTVEEDTTPIKQESKIELEDEAELPAE